MKRFLSFILFFFVVIFSISGEANTLFEFSGKYYRVFSESSLEHAQKSAEKLDTYIKFYNEYFHFDLNSLGSKLKVKLFNNKSSFDNYLMKKISNTKTDFVFLKYSDLSKSELVGILKENDNFTSSLIAQNFIQFLRSFIDNPPLWLQEGFSLYIEKSIYVDANKTIKFKNNLDWVEALKPILSTKSSLIPKSNSETIEISDDGIDIHIFYAKAWGLISFLINSENKFYNRILWDSINALSPKVNLKDNETAVIARAFSWTNKEEFYVDFKNYIYLIKTYSTLVKEGMELYSQGELDKAEETLKDALSIEKNHHIPYYYLGLIYYSKKDDSNADYYYKRSLNMGGTPGLIYYALGINAYSHKRHDDAINFFNKAREADPSGYSNKVEKLLERITKER